MTICCPSPNLGVAYLTRRVQVQDHGAGVGGGGGAGGRGRLSVPRNPKLLNVTMHEKEGVQDKNNVLRLKLVHCMSFVGVNSRGSYIVGVHVYSLLYPTYMQIAR